MSIDLTERTELEGPFTDEDTGRTLRDDAGCIVWSELDKSFLLLYPVGSEETLCKDVPEWCIALTGCFIKLTQDRKFYDEMCEFVIHQKPIALN